MLHHYRGRRELGPVASFLLGTLLLAGVAGAIWMPLAYVVLAVFGILGVLAALGTALSRVSPTAARSELPASPARGPAFENLYRTIAHHDRDRLRATDADRERGVAWLGWAARQGCLGVDELEARIARAQAAVTLGDLAVVLDDLPIYRP